MQKAIPHIMLFLLLFANVLASQELLKPKLKYTNACASNSFNAYEVEITFINAVFNSDNIFSIELSDKNGSFSNPTVLKTITNKNSAFRFSTEFSFPNHIRGKHFKIRIKSSSPEKTSPYSDRFEAFYMSEKPLILNNFEDVTLCESESKEIKIAHAEATTYQWYRNNEKFTLDDDSIEVSEPGLYYCEVYYGSCNSTSTSNIIEVKKIDVPHAAIKGESEINLCENNSHTLEATEDNANYIYTWFKNDVKIENLPGYSPHLIITDNSGSNSYSVKITNQNGCSASSNPVLVHEIKTDFEITNNTQTISFLLHNETRTIAINHNATNANIKWFKDNNIINNGISNEITISETGTYFAEIKNSIHNCSTIKKSAEFIFYPIQKIEGVAELPTNYTSCYSLETKISIENIKAIDTNNNYYNLTPEQTQLLDFKWYLNDVIIANETQKEINISNYEKNGKYHAEITNGNNALKTNILTIELGLPEISITSSDSYNTFCNDKKITLSANSINSVNYEWFLDGALIPNQNESLLKIDKPGVYQLQINGFGCAKSSNIIEILPFDVSTINFDFDDIIEIENGTPETLNVYGGEDYQWLDNNNNILSTDSYLEVSQEGNYTILVKKNGCSTQKEFSVKVINTVIDIPNILTPNGDGINDYWVLPLNFSFKEDVNIEVFNARGSLVFKSNYYQNNWPENNADLRGQLYYFVIKKKNNVIKKGTITVIN